LHVHLILNIFNIDQLIAMQLANDTWSSIKESSISNYWRYTKIIPYQVQLVQVIQLEHVSSTRQNLGAKTFKKCCHVGILEVVVHWPLASSVKAEWTNFCSPPIKLLESFVCTSTAVVWSVPEHIVNTTSRVVYMFAISTIALPCLIHVQ
jgi:hypothetical protein